MRSDEGLEFASDIRILRCPCQKFRSGGNAPGITLDISELGTLRLSPINWGLCIGAGSVEADATANSLAGNRDIIQYGPARLGADFLKRTG